MRHTRKLVGITGNANVGKDFAANLLAKAYEQQGKNVAILSLALKLKSDMYNYLLDQFGINILDCTRAEKNLVRPILIAHGDVKRLQTKGQFFTSHLETLAEFQNSDVVIITDIRYDEYQGTDEYDWLRGHGGKLINIDRDNVFPANEKEATNGPKLRNKADIVIKPPFFSESEWDQAENYYKSIIVDL